MHKLLLVAVVLCLFVGHQARAQEKLSPADWQADLRFLQKTVHDDYSFLFKKITSEQFDSDVEQLHKAIPGLAEHEIVAGLARIVSSFQYGHTVLGLKGNAIVDHHLPINLYHFSDGVFIEGVHKDYANALGARVVAIEGMPIDEALQAIRPIVPAENDQFFKAYAVSFLGVPEFLHAQGIAQELDREVTLTLEKDGKTFDSTIRAVDGRDFPTTYGFAQSDDDWLSIRNPDQTPLYLKNLDKIYFFEHLPKQKAVYIRHSQIQDDPAEDIPAFYKRVVEFIEENDVEKLVLDVRLNGGGNNYKNKPIVTGIIGSEKINQPGKLFVIIGRRTFSACQNLVNELDNYTNAIFVGEPTSENINFYGDNRQVELPNSKIPVFLSFAWWQDKPQWENEPWTAPHVAVDMSFDDYCNNRDPVLDAALEFSDDDFVLDPMARMTELFQAGKLEQLESEARQMVGDPRYRFFDFEAAANKAGYDLLGEKMVDESIWVFDLNTRLFPESANAWDSLAEAHWKADKVDKAIELYNRAINLDPEGTVADNAREMLKQIESEKD